jgi:hypothetical protein
MSAVSVIGSRSFYFSFTILQIKSGWKNLIFLRYYPFSIFLRKER